jgi:hypothetical protein
VKLTFLKLNFLGVPRHPEHRHVARALGTWSHPEVLRPDHPQVSRTLQGQRDSQESRVTSNRNTTKSTL